MYENQTVAAKFELYQDPATGQARLRPREGSSHPQRPNPTLAAPTVTRRPVPAAWERPTDGPRNPATAIRA